MNKSKNSMQSEISETQSTYTVHGKGKKINGGKKGYMPLEWEGERLARVDWEGKELSGEIVMFKVATGVWVAFVNLVNMHLRFVYFFSCKFYLEKNWTNFEFWLMNAKVFRQP